MNFAKKIQRIVRNRTKWLDQNRGFIEQEQGTLERGLSEGGLQGLILVSIALNFMGSYYGKKGEVSIYLGDEAGWEDVARSIAYRFWAMRIDAKAYEKAGAFGGATNLATRTGEAACLSCILTVAQVAGLCDISKQILQGMANGRLVDGAFWAERRFEPFALWLFDRGTRVPDGSCYSQLAQQWQSNDIGRPLTEVCDYHCANMTDHGQEYYPVFHNAPFDLIPCEVLAIQRIREKDGLATPMVIHPILDDRFCHPEKVRFASDPTTKCAEAAYFELFGEES